VSFRIEDRGHVKVVQYLPPMRGCRPASDVEIELWADNARLRDAANRSQATAQQQWAAKQALIADHEQIMEALRIINVARQDSLTGRPDAYELWEIQLTREESAKVRAALTEGGQSK
jgi:hypothetical protein